MAVEPATDATNNGDMPSHVRDYSKFTAMLKWGAIISFIGAMLVLVIISK
jgi:hypothetical protein